MDCILLHDFTMLAVIVLYVLLTLYQMKIKNLDTMKEYDPTELQYGCVWKLVVQLIRIILEK